MTATRRGRSLERARQLGWTVHTRLTPNASESDNDTDTDRARLVGEVFGLLVELDDRSLETWRAALIRSAR